MRYTACPSLFLLKKSLLSGVQHMRLVPPSISKKYQSTLQPYGCMWNPATCKISIRVYVHTIPVGSGLLFSKTLFREASIQENRSITVSSSCIQDGFYSGFSDILWLSETSVAVPVYYKYKVACAPNAWVSLWEGVHCLLPDMAHCNIPFKDVYLIN